MRTPPTREGVRNISCAKQSLPVLRGSLSNKEDPRGNRRDQVGNQDVKPSDCKVQGRKKLGRFKGQGSLRASLGGDLAVKEA